MRQILTVFFVLCSHILGAQNISERLDTLLAGKSLRTSEVGLAVFDLTTDEFVYRYQDEKLYRPASTQKIITSVTALACLGVDYTLDTRLCYTGSIEGDTLKGNLYLVGGMDPLFMEEHLDSLVDAVVQSGIRCIADTLVADISMMDSVYWGPGWSWDDAPDSFQPYLSPLMLHGGCVEVIVTPTQKDSLPEVKCRPESGIYKIVNSAISHQPQAGKFKVTRNWLVNDNTIMISGNVSRKTTSSLSLYSSQTHFLDIFVERLSSKGVNVIHTAYSMLDESIGSVSSLITIRRSLKTVLTEALKESNNLCAESLLFHLAKQNSKRRLLGFKEGCEAINDFMEDSLGFNKDGYSISDGSGVSLYNYVSPRLLLEYLRYAYHHPTVFPWFYDSLPIAGIDGTLKHRMKKTSAYRNVRAKTGSVKGVSSLAGYVKAANGHQLAFVIINQNVMKLKQARDFQDKVCVALSE